MKDDFNTNSHYLTYAFSLLKVGRMYFLSSGVKGLNRSVVEGIEGKGMSFLFGPTVIGYRCCGHPATFT